LPDRPDRIGEGFSNFGLEGFFESLDDRDQGESDLAGTELFEEGGREERVETILEDRRTDCDTEDLTERAGEAIEGALKR
jgi:hypothetical protein